MVKLDYFLVSDIPDMSRQSTRRSSPYFMSVEQYVNTHLRLTQLAELRGMHPDLIRRMIANVTFIADHFRALEKEDSVSCMIRLCIPS